MPIKLNFNLGQSAQERAAELAKEAQERQREQMQQAFQGLIGGAPGPFASGLQQAPLAEQQPMEQIQSLANLASAGITPDAARGYQELAGQFGPMSPQQQLGMEVQQQQLTNAQLQGQMYQMQLMQLAQERGPRYAEDVARLNGRYLQQIAPIVEVSDAVQQIRGSLESGSSLGALAATIKLAKVLDPTSVVREGEVTTVQGGIGIAEQLINSYNRLFGQGFTPEGAAAMADIVDRLATPLLDRGQRITDEFRKLSEYVDVPPELVITGAGFMQPGSVRRPQTDDGVIRLD